MTQKLELHRETVKQLLEIIIDATDLLEEIPEKQDADQLSQISQVIGAELEARINTMHEIEERDPVIKDLLEAINNQQTKPETLEELEESVLNR